MHFYLKRVPALRPNALPKKHPVRVLFSAWPCLEDQPTVRMLFRLIFQVYGDRLAKLDELPEKLNAAGVASALMFFENIPTDVMVGADRLNLHRLYLEAIDRIRNTRNGLPPIPPRQKAFEDFCTTIAILMHGIRRARNNE